MRENILIRPKGKKFYFMSRAGADVWNKTTKKEESYDEKNREHYAQEPKYAGGGVYVFPSVSNNILVVFEQKDKKPSDDDKIIATFGDANFKEQ